MKIDEQFELIALIAAVLTAALVASDGETNWLEGAELPAVYLILGLAFFFLPACPPPCPPPSVKFPMGEGLGGG